MNQETHSARITPDDVAKIAKLARLDPNPEQIARYARQMAGILDYMDVLDSVDTSRVEPMYSPVAGETVFREDSVQPSASQEEILANAPDTDGKYFIVPKTVF